MASNLELIPSIGYRADKFWKNKERWLQLQHIRFDSANSSTVAIAQVAHCSHASQRRRTGTKCIRWSFNQKYCVLRTPVTLSSLRHQLKSIRRRAYTFQLTKSAPMCNEFKWITVRWFEANDSSAQTHLRRHTRGRIVDGEDSQSSGIARKAPPPSPTTTRQHSVCEHFSNTYSVKNRFAFSLHFCCFGNVLHFIFFCCRTDGSHWVSGCVCELACARQRVGFENRREKAMRIATETSEKEKSRFWI